MNSQNKQFILNKLCQYNEYILSFQTTKNTKDFANEIIKLRDTTDYNDITNLSNILDLLITELEKQQKDDKFSEYIDCILDCVLKSKKFLLNL
jgi:hemerythrin superfamily protein